MSEEKLKQKHKIFEVLLHKKQERFKELSNFQDDQLESINDADLDNNSIMENQTEQMLRETRVENESLDHLKQEINYLEDFQSFKENDKVGPSTIVKTDMANLVISVPQRTFEVDGEKFNGVSTKSPIYEALEGRTAGDKVDFNGQNIEIKEVI